jgi:septal ring factor EnvC (AmiA/AmiB activator)
MFTTTTATAIQDLRENLAAAQQHQRKLVKESRNLPQELRQASRSVARERAASAREGQAGDQLLAVASERDVDELRAREKSLPLELWSQQLVVSELDADVHRAELAAVEAELKETGPAFEQAQRDLAAAEKKHGDAYSAHTGAASRADLLRTKLRDANSYLTELEENVPVA